MYSRRLKIFVVLCAVVLGLCLLRLAQMQLLSFSYYRRCIADLQKNKSRQLSTVRGKILDRKAKVLALDQPRFELGISYKLTIAADERYQRATLLDTAAQPNPTEALANVANQLKNRIKDLQNILERCAAFYHIEQAKLQDKIQKENDSIWARRTFLAWRRNCQDSDLFKSYSDVEAVLLTQAIADFETKFPDKEKRLLLAGKVPIADLQLDESWPLLELKTDDDVLAAQLEFMDTEAVVVVAKATRVYPYSCVAAQTIGWVGPLQTRDTGLFSHDRLKSYLQGELYGRPTGAEYVCEALLRGRRGEIIYNFDNDFLHRTERQFGKDVSLTLDIELAKRIEEYLADENFNPNYKAPTSVVLIDVATGDILALVSIPAFDLNRIRIDYAGIANDPNTPLRNRTINQRYPPGSVIKPLILIAGLEDGKISPGEIINCPSQPAPKGWPDCWIFNRHRIGHDQSAENHARNAIKGSCNIYFSRLAERIKPSVLQSWLFKFGYGRKILTQATPFEIRNSKFEIRNFRQLAGVISSDPARETRKKRQNKNLENLASLAGKNQLPPLQPAERRFFGIGQGNLRVTPLQVANTMATIARGGLYKTPHLIKDESDELKYDLADLNISPRTLAIVRDGMSAVVNEPGGTAYKEFAHSGLAEQDVKVYGKTGSTEKPDNAWFSGFAEDSHGRSIAIAVVIEGGQHGSADAGPLARDIIQFCIEADYIGQTVAATE